MKLKHANVSGGIILLALVTLLAGCSGTRPKNLGAPDGSLAPCPDSPNCVSSQSRDEGHFIEPITFTGDAVQAWQRVAEIVRNQPRVKIINESDEYLYAEFSSALWGFVDDVEFALDAENSIIHIRSASRLGYSDLGMNRKRVETIRALYQVE